MAAGVAVEAFSLNRSHSCLTCHIFYHSYGAIFVSVTLGSRPPPEAPGEEQEPEEEELQQEGEDPEVEEELEEETNEEQGERRLTL